MKYHKVSEEMIDMYRDLLVEEFDDGMDTTITSRITAEQIQDVHDKIDERDRAEAQGSTSIASAEEESSLEQPRKRTRRSASA